MKQVNQPEMVRQLNRTTTNLLIELDPGEVALGVGVLQAKEPDLAEAYGLHDLIEQLLAGRRLLDRELQLRVHRCHADVHLEFNMNIEYVFNYTRTYGNRLITKYRAVEG